MTDIHNTPDSELDDALALIKYSVEYRETHGGCPPEVKAIVITHQLKYGKTKRLNITVKIVGNRALQGKRSDGR